MPAAISLENPCRDGIQFLLTVWDINCPTSVTRTTVFVILVLHGSKPLLFLQNQRQVFTHFCCFSSLEVKQPTPRYSITPISLSSESTASEYLLVKRNIWHSLPSTICPCGGNVKSVGTGGEALFEVLEVECTECKHRQTLSNSPSKTLHLKNQKGKGTKLFEACLFTL